MSQDNPLNTLSKQKPNVIIMREATDYKSKYEISQCEVETQGQGIQVIENELQSPEENTGAVKLSNRSDDSELDYDDDFN